MKTTSEFDKLADKYQFIEGEIPSGYKIDYDPSLFNTPLHRKIQSENNWHSYHIIRKDKKKIIGSVHFCLKDHVALSPFRAPYGSIELTNTITTLQLFEFIGFYERHLLKKGITKIVIKNYPEIYNTSQHNSVSVLLLNYKYSISNAELGACIKINDAPFIDRIDLWEKRKLKQSQKAKLTFSSISLNKLKDTYQFIFKCRKERGQSLSMSCEDLSHTVNFMKSNFICFGVYQQEELIAASISIKVNKKVLYNFYSAHSKKADALSPVVFLINGIYSWCVGHKVELLDLGTSAWGGKPNFSLIDFKMRLGAEPSMKLTFEKKLKK